MTHRQYAAWVAWRNHCDVQMAPPSLTDWQLMRVAQRVQQVLSRAPNAIRLEDQRVEFDGVGKKAEMEPTAEQVSQWSLAKWLPVARNAPGFRFTKAADRKDLKRSSNGEE